MSRIGRLPITIPAGVDLKVDDRHIVISGPKGKLSCTLINNINLEIKDHKIMISVSDSNLSKYHGLTRALIFNMVHGVSEGWTRVLELSGTGYRAVVEGSNLNLSLGFSHPVVVVAPPGITFEAKDNKITVFGADKIMVGEIAARIRQLKKADPYKAKGFKYQGEVIIRKAGKAAKTVSG